MKKLLLLLTLFLSVTTSNLSAGWHINQAEAEDTTVVGVTSGYISGVSAAVMCGLIGRAVKLAATNKMELEDALCLVAGISLSAGVSAGTFENLKNCAKRLNWGNYRALGVFTEVTGSTAALCGWGYGLVLGAKEILAIPIALPLL